MGKKQFICYKTGKKTKMTVFYEFSKEYNNFDEIGDYETPDIEDINKEFQCTECKVIVDSDKLSTHFLIKDLNWS